jgi:hypothetical protein
MIVYSFIFEPQKNQTYYLDRVLYTTYYILVLN